MIFRKAHVQDIDAVAAIYDEIHTAEETGEAVIGWARGVYPSRNTALEALTRGDLFAAEDEGRVVGAAIINQIQVDVYEGALWRYDAPASEIMVLHTLVISPKEKRRGYGQAFVAFYEEYARQNGCAYLRLDTNEKNARARAMYKKLGYAEIGMAPCAFNGIEGVKLVLLEKRIGRS